MDIFNLLGIILPVIGVLGSAIISWLVTKYSFRKEMEKQKLSWEREDTLSSDNEYAEMVFAVTDFLKHRNTHRRMEASKKIIAIQVKETGIMALSVDNLFHALDTIEDDNSGVESALREVINHRRKTKSSNE